MEMAGIVGTSPAPSMALEGAPPNSISIDIDRETTFMIAGAGSSRGRDVTFAYPFPQHELLRDCAEGMSQVQLLILLLDCLLQRHASGGL